MYNKHRQKNRSHCLSESSLNAIILLIIESYIFISTLLSSNGFMSNWEDKNSFGYSLSIKNLYRYLKNLTSKTNLMDVFLIEKSEYHIGRNYNL